MLLSVLRVGNFLREASWIFYSILLFFLLRVSLASWGVGCGFSGLLLVSSVSLGFVLVVF